MKETGFSVRENELLNMLAAGELDGIYDMKMKAKNGMFLWFAIANGIPTLCIENPVIRKVEDGELIHELGETIHLSVWDTEEAKLRFLKQFGEYCDHRLVRDYADANRQTVKIPEPLIPLTRKQFHEVYDFDIGHCVS